MDSFDGTYNKKSLSQRWNDFDGIKIQRDMYSAFLIMNINNDLESFDINKCNDRFDNFKRVRYCCSWSCHRKCETILQFRAKSPLL